MKESKNGMLVQDSTSHKMSVPPRVLLDSVPDLIAFINADLRYEYVNVAWERWMGKEAGSVLGKRVDEVHGKDAFDRLQMHVDRVLSGNQSRFEYPVVHKNRLRHLDVSYAAVLGDSSKVKGYTVHVTDITEKKETERKFTDFIENATVGLHWVDGRGIIVWANDAELNMLGYSRDEYIGHHISEFHADPEIIKDILDRLSRNESLHEYEALMKRKDGSIVNVSTNSNVFRESGKFIHTRCFTVDITKRKRAEEALRESEQRFRMITDLVPIIIWTTDEGGRVTYLNSQWTELTGKQPREGYGDNWLNWVHPDDRDRAYKEWQQSLAVKKVYQSKFRYRDSAGNYSFHAANGEPRYNEEGQFLGYFGIQQDVTIQEQTRDTLEKVIKEKTFEITRQSEDLKRSEERYHRMIEEVQDYAIILLNPDGIVENWNRGAEKIKGYTASEIVGKSFELFYTEEDRKRGLPAQLIDKARREGRATHEGWRVKKDGSTFWASVVLTALHSKSDEVIGFSKVTRDLTGRKAVEDELKDYSRKLQAKNEQLENMNQELGKMNQELASFAYVSSHDLQEPLRKIQAFSSRIVEVEGKNFDDKTKDYFGRIQNAAHRMRLLIDDILSYSRASTSERKFELTDLNQLLNEVLDDLHEVIEEKKATVSFSPLPSLNVIPFQFQQLIVNLLANALKFTRPGVPPEITIRAGMVKGHAVKNVMAAVEKNYHHISISDNGIGFDPAHQSRIFEIFQRLHNRKEYEGTGVGLAICKKIMENHHGFITAEGEVNKGATFDIYLPA